MDVVAILRTLVGFDTTSHLSNLPLIEWVVDYLTVHGAHIRLTWNDDHTKANVVASFGPPCDGGVVLSGHTDVVPVTSQDWVTDPFVLAERDGRLYGRGTADMKGFIACCLAAAPSFSKASLRRPIHLALSYDEEVGCLGVPRLIANLISGGAKPAIAIIGEPTGMRIADRHRGFCGHHTTFHGAAAHSSNPGAGANAIYPAASFIQFLQTMSREMGDGIGQTTFNVGRIDGGSAINIVPNRCEVTWEFRPAVEADVRAICTTLDTYLRHSIPQGVNVEHETLIRVPPLMPSSNQTAVALTHEVGGEVPTVALPFGTEAGFFQDAGIPAVVCGPGSIEQAHQPNEWVAVDQLEKTAVLLERLTCWASSPTAGTRSP
jgi:acetylornithine deacetylase